MKETPNDIKSTVLNRYAWNLSKAGQRQDDIELTPFLRRMMNMPADNKDPHRAHMALDWLIRTYTPEWLTLVGLTSEADELGNLPRITNTETSTQAFLTVASMRDRLHASRESNGFPGRKTSGVSARACSGEINDDPTPALAGFTAAVTGGDAAWLAAFAGAADDTWNAANTMAGDAVRIAVYWMGLNDVDSSPIIAKMKMSSIDLLTRMIEA